MIQNKHWILFYCEWLFNLLKRIGYQVDYDTNTSNKYYDISLQLFTNNKNMNTIEFPHKFFLKKQEVNFKNISAIFLIFESILTKNHLDSMNYKLPLNFLNFRNMILKKL